MIFREGVIIVSEFRRVKILELSFSEFEKDLLEGGNTLSNKDLAGRKWTGLMWTK